MLVTKEQLKVYEINSEFWFARRTGSGNPISRDQYFINFPNKLQAGIYCAIGDDTAGWELEQYNGVNWVICAPDETYRLVITSEGLKSLTNTVIGGYKLNISGIKIIDQTVNNPGIPLIEWKDENLLASGNVVYTVGTLNAKHDAADLTRVLTWRYNNATGGLQYCLDLGISAKSDDNKEEWDIGTIGLYVKDTDGFHDILFAIATLPSVVRKYDVGETRIGNRLKFYMNTVLSNLGFVSNVDVIEDYEMDLPEVPNETLLDNPTDSSRMPHNCYLVDNLFGSNMPALAVPRPLNCGYGEYRGYTGDWAYFQPTTNYIYVGKDKFANDVEDYMFVYWNDKTQKYDRAQGHYKDDEYAENTTMPVGVRVGNNIVYSGEVTNFQDTYSYTVRVYNGGLEYESGDILDLIVKENLIIRVQVTSVNDKGTIVTGVERDGIILLEPTSGAVDLGSGTTLVDSVHYDKNSQLPRKGNGARFSVSSTKTNRYVWSEDFTADWLNKPVYCDRGDNAGKPTLTPTDCFLGWVTGQNSMQLALDLRNEASETNYGTTRYATDAQVKDVVTNRKAASKYSVTPETLQNNYIQKTLPTDSSQPGHDWDNPIYVDTCVQWKQMVVGKNVRITNEKQSSHWDNGKIDFWGKAYRAEWADLAEYYEADKFYEPGTLITFGAGTKEISKAQFEADGVISSKPGLQLGEKKNENYLPVALVGRVPVLMDGNSINYFGDKIYLSRIKPGTASTVKNGKCIGKIIDKDPGTKRLVECVIRIDFDNK